MKATLIFQFSLAMVVLTLSHPQHLCAQENHWGDGLLESSIVSLVDGKETTVGALKSQGQAVVIIEEGCAPCAKLVRHLQTCHESLHSKVSLVSMSSTVKSKQLLRTLGPHHEMFILKHPSKQRLVPATPLSLLADRSVFGSELECRFL